MTVFIIFIRIRRTSVYSIVLYSEETQRYIHCKPERKISKGIRSVELTLLFPASKIVRNAYVLINPFTV